MNGEELGLRSSLGSTPRRAIKRDKEREEEAENWTKIDMGGMNLKKLGPELFRYSFLTTLYVPHNNLTSIPPCVSSLVNLVHLDASSNKLISLPPEMGMLTQLSDLFVFDNLLTSLPPELGTLYNLDRIGIEGNPLPETLRSLLEKEGTQSLIAFLRDSCPVAPPPPERDWITIETDSFPSINASNPDAPPPETFSILCYNILCDKAATSHMYGYTPSWALSWDYRKELILQEVMGYGADILCLQVGFRSLLFFGFRGLVSSDKGVYFRRLCSRSVGGRYGAVREVLPPPSFSAGLRVCVLPQVEGEDHDLGREAAR
jgi:CCR4-NOT transcription complex subunit 6